MKCIHFGCALEGNILIEGVSLEPARDAVQIASRFQKLGAKKFLLGFFSSRNYS